MAGVGEGAARRNLQHRRAQRMGEHPDRGVDLRLGGRDEAGAGRELAGVD